MTSPTKTSADAYRRIHEKVSPMAIDFLNSLEGETGADQVKMLTRLLVTVWDDGFDAAQGPRPSASVDPDEATPAIDPGPGPCVGCNKPAVCFGVYECPTDPVVRACNDCCMHGNEDGWCKPIAPRPSEPLADGARVCGVSGPEMGTIISAPTVVVRWDGDPPGHTTDERTCNLIPIEARTNEAPTNWSDRGAIVARLKELAALGRDPMTWLSWDEKSRFLLGCATLIALEFPEQCPNVAWTSTDVVANAIKSMTGEQRARFVECNPMRFDGSVVTVTAPTQLTVASPEKQKARRMGIRECIFCCNALADLCGNCAGEGNRADLRERDERIRDLEEQVQTQLGERLKERQRTRALHDAAKKMDLEALRQLSSGTLVDLDMVLEQRSETPLVEKGATDK